MLASSPAQVRHVTAGIGGGTSAARGEELHRFVLEHKPQHCLELGFAHGVSSVWIASALEANGSGRLTSVDTVAAHDRDPHAKDTLARAGLSDRVDLVFEESSYTWFLHRVLREQQRPGNTIEALYDFVFLDGAHTWDVDALAFALVDRLLKPGGWLLLDDLDWAMPAAEATGEQVGLAQVKEVYELLVLTHPQYDVLRTDGQWAFARKSTSPAPAVRTVINRDLVGSAREIGRLARSKLGRTTLPG